jgi:hypothetical protein
MVPELMVMVFEAKTAPTEATSATPLAISKARLFLFFPAAEVMFSPRSNVVLCQTT